MAFAAVISLSQILKQLLHSDAFPIHFSISQIESLNKDLLSLQSFLEKNIHVPKSEKAAITDLEIQIRDSVYEAQDIIELCISSQCSKNQQLKSVIQIINSTKKITENVIGLNLGISDLEISSVNSGDDRVSSRHISGKKTKIVGLEKDLEKLHEQLTGGEDKLEVIPIVGMAGIGKTTLATALYDDYDPNLNQHFDTRAWVTVSQEFRFRDIFLGILTSMKKVHDKTAQESDDQLADYVYKSLKKTRYLVVIDDMWDTEVWDRVRRFFPDDRNKSRLILTTRISKVAEYASSSRLPHEMSLLSEENSWKLLREKAFANGNCPPQLMEIGMHISKNCGGLGLVLVVVGGLLYKGSQNLEYWKIVAEDIASALASTDEPCVEILSLSYNHLPSRLKGCFLYLGVFPEDHEISVSKLIKLWVAEGFLRPSEIQKNMEDVAFNFLMDLVERNLVLPRKLSSNGQIKTCKIHDLIRDLCVKESRNEKSCHVVNRYVEDFPESTDLQRRVSVHRNILMCDEYMYDLTKSLEHTRSLLYVGPYHHHPLPFSLTFVFLRVLDALSVYFIGFPSNVVELIHLRYFSFTFNGKLHASISKLQNLQILIVRQHPQIIFVGSSVLPVEIWNMPELRHVQFSHSDLPDILDTKNQVRNNSVLLGNLQTLSSVSAYCCTKEILRNIPELKELEIWIESPNDDDVPFYINELEKLETIKFTVLVPIPGSRVTFQPNFSFPLTIKKVILSGCGLPWDEISVLGNLPYLEVLKLRESAFTGEEWEPVEDEFSELKFLLLEFMDLVSWKATESHFPSLETLIFKHCYDLEEIPLEIGTMGALQLIELEDCSPSAAASAKRIQVEQKKLKNEDLQVRVSSSWE